MTIHVRRILGSEADRLRRTRLAALLDAPGAFASTHAAEVDQPLSFWAERARRGAGGELAATFVADDGQGWVGLVGAVRESIDDTSVELVSMWVAPRARRAGVGRRLVAAVIDWAAEVHASEVSLWVMDGNGGAQALYRRTGFTVVDEPDVDPHDPCRDQTRMSRRCPQRQASATGSQD